MPCSWCLALAKTHSTALPNELSIANIGTSYMHQLKKKMLEREQLHTLQQYLRLFEGPVVGGKGSSKRALPKGNDEVPYPEEAKEMEYMQTE